MKSTFRLIFRKIRSNVAQLLGLILLLSIGVAFFLTLVTIVLRYEETAEQFFIDQSYADVTLYGVFDNEDIAAVSAFEGVLLAEGRVVRDFRDGERIIRAVSLTESINIPYLYDGRFPLNETEVIVLERTAAAMDFSIGDTFPLGDAELLIVGITASPECIYLVQNERTPMAQADRFGVVFVVKDFFDTGYNEIVVLADNSFEHGFTSDVIGAFRVTTRENQINYDMYRDDLDQIGSFAYIFPLIFAILIFVTIYIMLSRTIQKDRRQIGTMKALGVSDKKIIGIYLSQFCLTALVGALLGCFLAIILSDIIIDIFSSMFVVPTLIFVIYPSLWFGAILFSVLLCAGSGLIAISSILSLLPTHLMRPRTPKGGKQILIERIGFLWNHLTFNTRYSVKNALRNKPRFFAVVLGMCGSLALLTFSLGFENSIVNTRNEYFNNFSNYDVIINFDPIPLHFPHPTLEQMDESEKALILHVETQGNNYALAIVESGFDMVNIPAYELQNGIIIPEYFAKIWGVNVGDALNINGYKTSVSAIAPQFLGLMLYTSFDYVNQITNEIPAAYNTIFGRSENVELLASYLMENNFDFATIADDETSFYSIMESISVLIWFMIACSIILGFTVLYSVGLINLSAREYEYMFIGVMGYPHKKIMSAHLKETIMQLVLAVPLGFILARLLLEAIKGEFSNSSFVIASAIFPQSYVIATVIVVGITLAMAWVTSRHINKLDIVEGLKAQDD